MPTVSQSVSQSVSLSVCLSVSLSATSTLESAHKVLVKMEKHEATDTHTTPQFFIPRTKLDVKSGEVEVIIALLTFECCYCIR